MAACPSKSVASQQHRSPSSSGYSPRCVWPDRWARRTSPVNGRVVAILVVHAFAPAAAHCGQPACPTCAGVLPTSRVDGLARGEQYFEERDFHVRYGPPVHHARPGLDEAGLGRTWRLAVRGSGVRVPAALLENSLHRFSDHHCVNRPVSPAPCRGDGGIAVSGQPAKEVVHAKLVLQLGPLRDPFQALGVRLRRGWLLRTPRGDQPLTEVTQREPRLTCPAVHVGLPERETPPPVRAAAATGPAPAAPRRTRSPRSGSGVSSVHRAGPPRYGTSARLVSPHLPVCSTPFGGMCSGRRPREGETKLKKSSYLISSKPQASGATRSLILCSAAKRIWSGSLPRRRMPRLVTIRLGRRSSIACGTCTVPISGTGWCRCPTKRSCIAGGCFDQPEAHA